LYFSQDFIVVILDSQRYTKGITTMKQTFEESGRVFLEEDLDIEDLWSLPGSPDDTNRPNTRPIQPSDPDRYAGMVAVSVRRAGPLWSKEHDLYTAKALVAEKDTALQGEIQNSGLTPNTGAFPNL
jgi:hypothetical protein